MAAHDRVQGAGSELRPRRELGEDRPQRRRVVLDVEREAPAAGGSGG
jgi:hypothetical protein